MHRTNVAASPLPRHPEYKRPFLDRHTHKHTQPSPPQKNTKNTKQAKLCDFGLCSAFIPGQALTDFCGSPGFFAPEMLSHSYDGPAADVWSLGCVVRERAHAKFIDLTLLLCVCGV